MRLCNALTSEADFLLLTWHRLKSRATSVLVITTASALEAPILIQNLSPHEITVRQVGAPVTTTVLPGELCRYAWDEPARQLRLGLSVPRLGVPLAPLGCRSASAPPADVGWAARLRLAAAAARWRAAAE